jgi:hypothetical protein
VFAADGSDLSSDDIPWDGTEVPDSPGNVTAAVQKVFAKCLQLAGGTMAGIIEMASYALRFANATTMLQFRNAANDAWLDILASDSENTLSFGYLAKYYLNAGHHFFAGDGVTGFEVTDGEIIVDGNPPFIEADDVYLETRLHPKYVWLAQDTTAGGSPLQLQTPADSLPDSSIVEMGFSIDGSNAAGTHRYFRRGVVTFVRHGNDPPGWYTSDGNPLITDSPPQWGSIVGASTDVALGASNNVMFVINAGTLEAARWNVRVWEIKAQQPEA